MSWYAFHVKNIYNRPSQYRELMALLRDKYGKSDDDFFVPGYGKDENPYGTYFFVREDEQPAALWESLRQEKYVSWSDGTYPLDDADIEQMRSYAPVPTERGFRFGDIAKVRKGELASLRGVVMGAGTEGFHGDFEVGFNLFQGPQFYRINEIDMEFERSIFEIWKFPRKTAKTTSIPRA